MSRGKQLGLFGEPDEPAGLNAYEKPIVAAIASEQGAAAGRYHPCRWPGCTVEVAAMHWGCLMHTWALPTAVRHALWCPPDSAEYQAARTLREGAAEIEMVLVEGA